MKKLLRTLIIVLLILAISSAVLGNMLFRKRELLQGRIRKLESAIITVSAMIEEDIPPYNDRPDYPERDLGEVTSELIDNPERSDFWQTFPHELEIDALQTMDLSKRMHQLMCYYRIDPITLKPMKDPLSGNRLVEGPGTMQEVLDEVTVNAQQQLERLNKTRHYLRGTREELVSAITELNERKQNLRTALNQIDSHDKEITAMEDKLKNRDKAIEVCKQEVAELNDAAAEHESTIVFKEETINEQKLEIEKLEEIIKRGPKNPEHFVAWNSITPGRKGSVAVVNEDCNFVVLNLTDEFMKQYRGIAEKSKNRPEPHLTIMRNEDGKRVFVTKVKLDRIDQEQGIGSADILNSWQQTKIYKGDEVLYF
ncbi:hypothetical protein ACFLS1_04470 [Verrucomicrobiota bacterium]